MSLFEGRQLRRCIRLGRFIVLVGLVLMAAGCTKNYGHFTKNAEVDLAFRQGDHRPDYQYFYAGRDNMPYAIIGINRNYSVPSRYWVPFDPESETLRKMSGNMYGKLSSNPAGYQILDPDGKIIGVWFSSVINYSVSVDQQNRTVEVLFPNPENSRSISIGLSGHNDWQ